MKHIALSAILSIAIISGCQKDCTLIHQDDLLQYPILAEGTFPTEDMTIHVGETVRIAPELNNPDDASFEWYLGSQLVSEKPSLEWTFTSVYDGELKCRISNGNGSIIVKVNIRTDHDFSKGFFIILQDGISFYDTERQARYDDIIPSVNNGLDITPYELNADIVGAVLENSTFTICLRHNTTNLEHLYIFDYPSMKLKTSNTVTTSITGMFPIGDSYAIAGDMDGLYRIDMISGSSVKITSESCTYGESIFGGAGILGDRIFLNTFDSDGTKVRYASTEKLRKAREGELTDNDFTEIDITQDNRTAFACTGSRIATTGLAEDGYRLVYLDSGLKSEDISLDFKPAGGKYWSSPTVNMTSDSNGNIYLQDMEGNIHKAGNGTVSSFIQADRYEGMEKLSGGLYTCGEDYICVISGESGYDSGSGEVRVFSTDGKHLFNISFEEQMPIAIVNGK